MKKNNYYNILVITGGMIFWWICNYLYHPLMLRYLTIEDFWVFGSLMWLMNLVMIITTAFILFLNKEVSKSIDDRAKLKYLFINASKILWIIWIICTVIFIVFMPILQNYLGIYNNTYFYLIAIILWLSFVSTVVTGFLRGLKKFEFLGVFQALSPLLKLIFGFFLAAGWYQIFGALFWILITTIFSLVVSYLYVYKSFSWVEAKWSVKNLWSDFRAQKWEISSFVFLAFFLAIFMNIDVILVKNIFDETTAGSYAGISILWKFLVFLLISIETVYYGQIMEHKQGSVPKSLIRNPILLIAIWIIWAIFINIFLGKWILTLIKPELAHYSYIYIISLVYYGVLAYINFFAKVLTAWGCKSVNIILLFFTVLLLISVYTVWNQSLEYFVYCFIGTGLLCSMALAATFYRKLNSWK